MDISRQEREELNALSKEVFGVSSKWQKFLKGIPEAVTKKVTETVPGENGAEPTTKEVDVPVMIGKSKVIRIRYYTVEETKAKLLEFKKQREEILVAMKKQEEEQKARQEQEELQKKIQEDISGSAAL